MTTKIIILMICSVNVSLIIRQRIKINEVKYASVLSKTF